MLGAIVNDWTVTGIVTLQSGVPVAVTQTTNYNAFAGFGTQRPNLVGDPTLPADERSPSRWFDTSAFAAAPQFTIGSSSRNPVRGPGYRNVDSRSCAASRSRARRFEGARRGVQPDEHALLRRAEHDPGSAAFGTITTAGDPRVVQLAVKFIF